MLHFNRRIGLLLRAQLDGKWVEKNSFDYPELGGQIVTIVGAGSIGSEIAKRAHALGMRTLGINRDGRAVEGFDQVVAAKDAAGAISKADHVVVCVPGVDANTQMVDAAWLSQMKPGAHFYNVGRGSTVDEAALLAALDTDRLAGAGLDVTDVEPLPTGHSFWKHPKVLLTQHKAMNSGLYWGRMTQLFADNLSRFVQGRPLLNIVHA
jgi:phosphoglycerate dehydrogenase-like enzyme